MAPPANAFKAVENETISTSTTVVKEANFEAKCKGAIMHCTEDVYIAFDEVANTASFFLIGDIMFDFPVEFTKVSALAKSSGGTLHIQARR